MSKLSVFILLLQKNAFEVLPHSNATLQIAYIATLDGTTSFVKETDEIFEYYLDHNYKNSIFVGSKKVLKPFYSVKFTCSVDQQRIDI